jgi:hypothetical protein
LEVQVARPGTERCIIEPTARSTLKAGTDTDDALRQALFWGIALDDVEERRNAA